MTDFDSAEFVYDVNSYQTALAIIPPASLTKDINALRAAYDKSFHSWAPHINLIYPFVRLESLNAATARIQHALLEANLPRIHLRLNEHGMFTHRHSSTIYRTCGDNSKLQLLRRLILDSLGKVTGPEEFIPHLTVGQSTPGPSEGRESLLTKTRMLPTIEWPLVDLAILQRQEDRTMKLWGRIRVSADEDISPCISKLSTEEEEAAVDSQISGTAVSGDVQEGITHRFDPSAGLWNPLRVASSVKSFGQMPTSLRISTYNVLIDSVYSARERCTTLLRTILSEAARADIVVLQEVSDEFLCHLLGDTETRQQYPYVTHAPPNQAGVAPLVNLRNIVILSRRSFRWEYVPFERRHKGAVVIKLDHIGNSDEDGNFSPLVLAGLHLTCGLTDGSVAAKASQLRNLIDHLQAKYAQNLWVVAGDFNLTTSKWTIDAALKTKSISLQTARTLVNLDEMLAEVALVDSYVFTRAEHDLKQADDDDDDVYDGEEGATFNPRDNLLAAKIVGREFGNRPQRYDKIYVKGNDQLRITGYNMFGLPDSNEKNDILHYGSDHWGVRTTLGPPAAFSAGVNDKYKDDSAVLNDLGASSVGDNERLKQLIRAHHTFPGQEEMHRRQEIFSFIKDILLQLASAETRVSLVAVPVGSYGLDVWTTSSDIDCLCIGSISSKTFFALAIQRLRRHSGEGVRILRKVEAHTGTMLELDVQGVHMDIQYCAAAGIAETWPAALSASATDPLFSLSQQTLSKLKAIRDMVYLQETTSDLPAFRTAYRFINLWASSRGIYAARFGFLGGLHISLMLNRVTKLFHSRTVASGAGGLDAACIIRAFFHYYAAFDWTKDAVKDPFLSTAPGMGRAYHRRAGEPMVILGFHVPYVNVARAATVPTVRVISDEIKRANELGMKYVAESESLSWNSILGERGDGVFDFLNSYKSYVRIDVQYWGNKGIELVGWLESRFPTLLVDLNRKLPEIYARLWPSRFTSDSNTTKGDGNTEYQGCYLIGLLRRSDLEEAPKSDEDRKLAQNQLTTILDRFAEQLRGNENFFDPSVAWADVSLVKRDAALGNLHTDMRQWGDNYFEEDLSELEEEGDDDPSISAGDLDLAVAAAEALKAEHAVAADEKARNLVSKGPGVLGKKLRPASDVLSRLRWDPNLNSRDYVVGYTDRFAGVKEIPLDKWKMEQTDEEFIPQHRIAYFKKRSDGRKVWDRAERRDELFASGVSG